LKLLKVVIQLQKTPCLASAGLPGQRVVTAPLADLPDAVRAAGLANPATVTVSRLH
jgi:hypothetical protein